MDVDTINISTSSSEGTCEVSFERMNLRTFEIDAVDWVRTHLASLRVQQFAIDISALALRRTQAAATGAMDLVAGWVRTVLHFRTQNTFL